MSQWKAVKATELLKALESLGWRVKRMSGSHRVLEHEAHPDFVFAFHDREEIGPVMLSRVAKRTGLKPSDL
ncbi:MAG TPA: type II toxin-antitoxin system HicA family toxin [Fimbriimonadaceae bacterium]|nr:type II toxin-antitoxin system HicA family toxin [Fimbriimonadaceae bacterium]